MTKFQRGELMEGWNDCPQIMMQANSSSTSVGSRSKRRTPRAYGSGYSSQTSVSSESTAPPREFSAEELRQMKETIATHVGQGEFKDEDKAFVTERLIEAFDGLEAQHQQFVARIADELLQKQKRPSQLKNEVLTYMMANSGVSTWAVGLKKLVEL